MSNILQSVHICTVQAEDDKWLCQNCFNIVTQSVAETAGAGQVCALLNKLLKDAYPVSTPVEFSSSPHSSQMFRLQAASAPPAKRRAREDLDADMDSGPPAFSHFLELRSGLHSDRPAADGSGGKSSLLNRLAPSRFMTNMSEGVGKVSAVAKKAYEATKAAAASRQRRGERRSSDSAAGRRSTRGSGSSGKTRKRKNLSQVILRPKYCWSCVASSKCLYMFPSSTGAWLIVQAALRKLDSMQGFKYAGRWDNDRYVNTMLCVVTLCWAT